MNPSVRIARTPLVSGALHGLLSVLLGAFAAHALRGRLPPRAIEVFQTGVHYQALHALVLLVIGALAWHLANPWLRRAALVFNIGIILFSGSLYLLAISGVRALGMITPIGGLALVLGWAFLLIAALRVTGSAADE